MNKEAGVLVKNLNWDIPVLDIEFIKGMTKSIHLKDYHEIVQRLKRLRLSAGLTQKEAAEKIGMPQSFISKIESVERRLDILELKKLVHLYKGDMKDILGL